MKPLRNFDSFIDPFMVLLEPVWSSLQLPQMDSREPKPSPLHRHADSWEEMFGLFANSSK